MTLKPDAHPESYCHQCDAPNPKWWSPEWPVVMGTHGGILCPRCYALNQPETFWVLTRWQRPDDPGFLDDLAAFLDAVSGLGDDSRRVAGCVIDYFAAKNAGSGVPLPGSPTAGHEFQERIPTRDEQGPLCESESFGLDGETLTEVGVDFGGSFDTPTVRDGIQRLFGEVLVTHGRKSTPLRTPALSQHESEQSA